MKSLACTCLPGINVVFISKAIVSHSQTGGSPFPQEFANFSALSLFQFRIVRHSAQNIWHLLRLHVARRQFNGSDFSIFH